MSERESRMQRAIDYIESHLTENIRYEEVAAQSYTSCYHFQRIFGILCGMTLGEYIRARRLTLAGAELATQDARVIDVALKYGYDSPDSFAKAFVRFHGVLPSQARRGEFSLRSFSRLNLNPSKKGGNTMHYKIEEKPEMILTGYRAHFTGTPYGAERLVQEEQLFLTTRAKQWLLRGASNNGDSHCVIDRITDEGYDFFLCYALNGRTRRELYDHSVTGVDFIEDLGLETITIPKTTYVIFKTSDLKSPIVDYGELLNRRPEVLSEWLPEMGFRLKEAPEIAVYHWVPKSERKIEIWLPIEKEQ